MGIKVSQHSLSKNKDELKEIVLSQNKEIQRLNEEIRLLRHALFGAKSEKLPVGPNPQPPIAPFRYAGKPS